MTQPPERPRRGLAMALSLVLAVIWGGSIPATKLGLAEATPLGLTALRYLVAAPMFLPLLWGRTMPPWSALWRFAGLGLVGIVVGQTAQTVGVGLTSAAAATIISAAIPIFVVILSAFRLRQPIQPRHALGLVAALSGVGIIAYGSLPPGAPLSDLLGTLEGDGVVLISVLAIAVYYVLSAALVARYSNLTVSAYGSIAGALFLAPIAAPDIASSLPRLGWTGWSVIFYLAALVTVLGNAIWFHALSTLPARIAAAFQYLQPLVGIALSALVLDEALGDGFWAGAAVIMAGIVLATLPGKQ